MTIMPPMWVTVRNLHLGVSSPSSLDIRNVTTDTASHAMSRRMTVSDIMQSMHETNSAQTSDTFPGPY